MRTTAALPLAIAGLGAGLASAPDAFAAGDEFAAGDAAMEQIIVTGTRLDTPAADVGSSLSIITGDDLERRGFDFVVDALATAPGVTVNQNGAFGGVATVRIRGAASEQTLVLIDGVPVNDPTSPGGGYDFSRLDPADIARIEILRGPQSTLWGSDAIGGVINVVTRTPRAGFGADGFLEGGSYDTFRGGAAIEGASDRGDFRLAVTGFRSAGISRADENDGNTERDGYDALTVNARGGLRLPGDARLDATLRRVEADTAIDGFGVETGVADSDESTLTEELSASLRLTVPLLDDRLEWMTMAGWSDIDRDSFQSGVRSFGFAGQRVILRSQGTFTLSPRHRFAVGAEHEALEADGESTSLDSLFGLYELRPVETLTLSFGVRVDDHDRFASETTRRVAAAWTVADPVTLRASWGEGFKAPTLFQSLFFCCGASAPNTALLAETSEAWDAGVEWRLGGRGSLTLTWFEQDFENLIDFSFVDGTYANVRVARSRGAELALGLRIVDSLSLNASYANIDTSNGTGQPLNRVPEHSADLELAFTPTQRLSGSLGIRYNGEQNDAFGAIERFTRVDLAARYRLNERTDLFARVENLLDADYQQVFGYGTPGLSGTFGIRVRLEPR